MAPDLNRLCQKHVVDTGVAPGIAVAVGAHGPGGWRTALGAAGTLSRSRREPVTVDSPFDLASLTKPCFAVTVARLVGHHGLSWDGPLDRWLSEASSTPCAGVSLELLLTHRAGLEPHRPLFAPLMQGRPLDRRRALRDAARARRRECVGALPREGFPALYSDLGYVLAGEAVRRASGDSIGNLVRRELSGPLSLDLGSAAQWLLAGPDFVRRVASTEVVAWRGGELRGVVHDENAWALHGHDCGAHAGLFGTAQSVLRFGCALLDALADRNTSLLDRAKVEHLIRLRPGGALRLGFDAPSGERPSAGPLASPRTFGHLGFTGTSFWCDPDDQVVTVVLTNRVHPTRDHVAIRAARPSLHAALTRFARGLR